MAGLPMIQESRKKKVPNFILNFCRADNMFVNKKLRVLMLDLHIMYLESNADVLGTRKKNTKASEIKETTIKYQTTG